MIRLLTGILICCSFARANAEVSFDRGIDVKAVVEGFASMEMKVPAAAAREVIFEGSDQAKSLQDYCPFYQDQQSCTLYNCAWQYKGCYAGLNTPAFTANYCRFSPDQTNCSQLGCEWKPAHCKAPPQTPPANNGGLNQYCPFYQDQQSCTLYNCSWQYKGCYAGLNTPAYAAGYCRFSQDQTNCSQIGCEWKPARCTSF